MRHIVSTGRHYSVSAHLERIHRGKGNIHRDGQNRGLKSPGYVACVIGIHYFATSCGRGTPHDRGVVTKRIKTK